MNALTIIDRTTLNQHHDVELAREIVPVTTMAHAFAHAVSIDDDDKQSISFDDIAEQVIRDATSESESTAEDFDEDVEVNEVELSVHEKLVGCIDYFEAMHDAGTNNVDRLRKACFDIGDYETAKTELHAAEIEHIEKTYHDSNIKRTSTGKVQIAATMGKRGEAYRSAKSVILGTLKAGLDLYDTYGLPISKDDMQAAINESKGKVKKVLTPAERLQRALKSIDTLLSENNATDLGLGPDQADDLFGTIKLCLI